MADRRASAGALPQLDVAAAHERRLRRPVVSTRLRPGLRESHRHRRTHPCMESPSDQRLRAGLSLQPQSADTSRTPPAQPMDMHAAEGRVRHDRRLSPNRSLSFMVGGGVVGVGDTRRSSGFRLRARAAHGIRLAPVALSPTWAVLLSARRDITVLNGLSSEPFESNAATLTIDGTAWRRLTMGVTGGYSQGRARSAQGGDFDQTLSERSARLWLRRSAGAGRRLRLYANTRFAMSPVASSSFPTQFGRNSVRVGVTMWLPLYGTF